MKTITMSDGRTIKLGRKKPIAHGLRLHLRDYITPQLPAPPATCDYSSAAATALAEVLLNDQYGDCVIAAMLHMWSVYTGNAGNLILPTNAQALAWYEAIGGFDPTNAAATDNGCDEETATNYVTANGFPDGAKPIVLAVDATNQNELMTAIWLFEAVLLGQDLPDAWVNPFPAPGGVWDVAGPGDAENGHGTCLVGYDSVGGTEATWGMLIKETWGALAQYAGGSSSGQAFVFLSPDMLNKASQKSPLGIDWATLQGDFQSLVPRGGLAAQS